MKTKTLLDLEISKFQLIRTDKNRIVVRYYDEEKDRFCKVCATQKLNIIDDRLLLTDDAGFLDFDHKLVYLGTPSVILQTPAGDEQVLLFDTANKPLSYPLLAVCPSLEHWTPVTAYTQHPNRVEMTSPDNQKIVYEVYEYVSPLWDHQTVSALRRL